MSGVFQDDKGNYSSLRVGLAFSYILTVWMYLDWRRLLFIEVVKETPDYSGLTELFIAMLVTFGLPLIAKSIQKKFEQ